MQMQASLRGFRLASEVLCALAHMKFWKKRYFIPGAKSLRPPPGSPRIFRFNHERDAIVDDVVTRTVESYGESPRTWESALSDTAYHETRRLHAQRDEEAREHLSEWRNLSQRLASMGPMQRRAELERIAREMAKDVAGNFDPRVYKAAKQLAPRLLTGIMNPIALTGRTGSDPLSDLLRVEGTVGKLQHLAERGTLVFVPTHSSNLDSLVVAQALQRTDLPPVVYGAGKNLFTNPIISFFMHNLGAYRVDRRIRAEIYKRVLKAYSCVMIERGFHSLFFPGGTRSRSNIVERRLKLGLAGSVLEAFSRNHAGGVPSRVWFVPTTINYELVLEAESLIEDHLKETGKSRFIIEDDEFSRLDRWVAFFRKVTSLKGACVIRFSEPLDPFGNSVDESGESLGPANNVIDVSSYIMRRGRPVLNHVRDRAYTKSLESRLVERYHQDTVIMVTQLVAHVLFRYLVTRTPGSNIFLRMRERNTIAQPIEECVREVAQSRERLRELEKQGQIRLSEAVREDEPMELVLRALHAWQGYHRRQTASLNGGKVLILDPLLLYYYQNRLVPWADELAPTLGPDVVRDLKQEIR